MPAAHARFGRYTLTYLDRARRAHTNFIVVTHGGALLACAQLLPDLRQAVIHEVGFCAHILGTLRIERVETEEVRSTAQLRKQVGYVGTKGIALTPGQWSAEEPRYAQRFTKLRPRASSSESCSSSGSEIVFGASPVRGQSTNPYSDDESSLEDETDGDGRSPSAGSEDRKEAPNVAPPGRGRSLNSKLLCSMSVQIPPIPGTEECAPPKPKLLLNSKLFLRRSKETPKFQHVDSSTSDGSRSREGSEETVDA
jgi:hypothetical protein